MEWKFFQLWAKAGCGMYVKETREQGQEQMGRRKGLERDRELKKLTLHPVV